MSSSMDLVARMTGSLRARLLWFLLAAIVLAAGAQALVAYRTVLKEADEIFDYHMQQMALSLRAGLPPSAAVGGLGGAEQNFDFVVQVWTADGVRIFESADQAALPQLAVLGFADVRARGTTYRVFSMQTRGLVIQVAQDMAARQHMAGTLALRTVAPVALMAPLLMLVVWWVVSRSLAPVARVRTQVASRQADDLSPVSEEKLPDEVRPLVQELNLLFDRVRQAFEAQKHFVADAAHELRSPLAALKLQVQGLQRASDDGARELAIGRLVAGIDRADEGATVKGQSEALRMLLRNLLENAVKYTPEEGRVDIAIARLDDAVELSVDDSGPGLPPTERERVLDRFYRSGEPQAPGSGLGLSIVKSIAELHGASVALDASPSLGGLRVVVRFPTRA
ncbi:ATP-binding protein [Variovorax sp. CT11-76]